MKKIITICCMLSLLITTLSAQPDRWQQKIKYNIDVKLDVLTNRFSGIEKLEYFNQSPDTLKRIFFHLYWNAFQPNSSMDVRSKEMGKTVLADPKKNNDGLDWDARVKDRIGRLTPNEIGYQRVKSVQINGVAQLLKEQETILEVVLSKPILPKSKTNIDIVFEAQVPLQVRRSGRDNKEGIRYSMSQWYPKMVEYDYQGWNANPYIAREFYGVWGDYEVNITIDKNYMVAAGGDLLNAQEVGFGYQQAGVMPRPITGNMLTWKWQAHNVHDFMWAADPTYKMITRTTEKGPLLRIIYKQVDSLENRWQKMADTCAMAYPLISKSFGAYPYKTYTFIQGGDGGMEYPMATLIKSASIGTAIHEWMHSWYQMILGTNEALYPWMDEGFTDYSSTRVMASLRNQPGFWHEASYKSYFSLAKSGYEEPASTHADHFNTNYAYSTAAYSKGAVFITQLGYIVGDSIRDKILLSYYHAWKFKHPNPNDFIRVAEKESGMELDWYKEYWINTTKTIDYSVGDIAISDGKTGITIKRIGKMPMPIDVLLTFKDGTQELHTIPLNLMYGVKPAENTMPLTVHAAWRWTHPDYIFTTSRAVKDLKSIEIDPSMRMADVNRSNNKLVIPD
ncbi:MAG: M1 family peptidase [Sphingobacteriia bacterium]|nr:MAG: M1 family peptidase [Sphingobacteriia bacterium]TAG31214.1 MAG: M1 family peptidase [Sphingobacteriia bacterium]TAH07485.1 MAG: M1 family peptidase [Sphingobacteriia bacterium]